MTGAAADVGLTACGVVSPFGVGTDAFAAGLRTGRSALRDVPALASSRPVGAVADFAAGALLPGSRGLREFDRTSLLLAGATALALDDAALAVSGRDDVGLAVGSTFGTISSIMQFDLEALRDGPTYVRPLAFPNTVLNAPAGRVAGLFGIRGVSATLSTGEASALDALAYAVLFLRAGRAACFLAGSSFGLSASLAEAFPAVLGEGAATFLVEPLAAARARGTRPRARVAGLAGTFLPKRGDGVALATAALAEVLAEARSAPADVDLVVAGGRGPAHAPALEDEVLARVFEGTRAAVRSLTPSIGDCLDASAGLGTAAALAAIADGAQRVLVSAFSRSGHCAFLVLDADAGRGS
jgi:3-oxoacyl-[acyl-carrier-protein] synthase II